MSSSITAAVARLDSICNLLHQMVAIAREENWPADLLDAAEKLAEDVTNRTGAIDSADPNSVDIHSLIAEAGTSMSNDLAAFGRALARDLTNSVK